MVVVIDATFFPDYGVLVARVPRLKRNIWWHLIERETVLEYQRARRAIEHLGYRLTAVVLDGRKGAPAIFRDIPVQLCQFHQMKAVTKYLTRRPETEAGYELRQIMLGIPKSTEAALTERLQLWYLKWEGFISEKTYLFPGSKHWFYTHRRVRSAYRSMKTNTPFLYTYQKHPDLSIPNTTNSLDGFFSYLKHLLNVHRGMRPERRRKLIDEILSR